ncbi:uncharacterized protein LOC122278703 [Carya illinoinensis]|uniref:uncharacterized protein LOC122278703 n=1 Tax=Carya illinoinensis TaxID=32201 RepID=UPI001C71DB74|nr:uncharacterized protein LOC122278703 [Carya illinoinensis]
MAELALRTPSTLREFMDRADDFVNSGDTLQALVDPCKEDIQVEQENRRADKKGNPSRRERAREGQSDRSLRLVHINLGVQEGEEEKESRHSVKTGGRYCKYHQTSSHWTKDCTTMRKRVVELAGTSELERMVAEQSKPKRHQETRQKARRSFSPERRHHVNNRQDRRARSPPRGDRNRAPIGEIKTIAGGFVGGGISTSNRKAYARNARYEEVFMVDRVHKQPKLSNERMVISFEEANREGIIYPHDDALVIILVIANYTTRRVLVDNGSSADILFWEAFIKMGIDVGRLRLSLTPLKGFSGDTIQPVGAITLPVTAGTGAQTATTMTDFLVVKALSSYNAILGRPTLNHLKAVTSTYHLKMKFPIDGGVGETRGEQALARECYVQELKKVKKEVCTVARQDGALPPLPPLVAVIYKRDLEVRDDRVQQHAKVNKPLELVTLYADHPGTTTRIGTQVPPKVEKP